MRSAQKSAILDDVQDAGVLIVGEPGGSIQGDLTVQGVPNVTIQRLSVTGSVIATNANALTVNDVTANALTVTGGSNARLRQITSNGSITLAQTSAAIVEGSTAPGASLLAGNTSLVLRGNQIAWLQILQPSAGEIVVGGDANMVVSRQLSVASQCKSVFAR